ncbi:MAG TPA: hypothetical protein VHM70_03095 [Polyangiaceae bacterium]|jgi:hypothetical protein|nr:hypothetical protein [Polyangiaceae bacterium]
MFSTTARAEDTPSPILEPPEFHGFASQGYIKSIGNNYLAKSKDAGSFEFSEVGLNFTKNLSEELRTGAQLFAHDLGPLGNFRPQFDWFYIDYHPRDWFGIRAGRIKVPFGLYNELNDVDVARQPILLPQSIYQADHREFLFAQTGGEIYGDVPLGPVGDLEYRLYGGTLSSDIEGNPPAPGVTVSNVNVPYIVGGRAMWDTPIDGLRSGVSLQSMRFDSDYGLAPELLTTLQALMLVPATVTSPFPVKFHVTRWVGSLAYNAHDWDLSAEYSRWLGGFDSPIPALLPSHVVNERYYAMASYRVNSWFVPGAYYSAFYPNKEERHGRQNYQHDLAISLRYDLTTNWLLKLEGHLMRGTAALENRILNEGVEPKDLKANWGVFLLKTTAYF